VPGMFSAGIWFLGSLAGGLAGVLLGGFMLGGSVAVTPMLQQVVSRRYAYFSRVRPFLQIDNLVQIALGQDAFLACLVVLCLLVSSSKRGRVALLALTSSLVIFRYGNYGEKMAQGLVSRPMFFPRSAL